MLDILSIVILSASAAACTAFMWVGSRRGFDWTDEGSAFLGMNHPDEFRGVYKLDFIYNSVLWKLINSRITRFRQLIVFIHSLSLLLLAAAFIPFLEKELGFLSPARCVELLLAIYVAGFTRYVFTREVSNYNLYTSLGVTLTTTFVLFLSILRDNPAGLAIQASIFSLGLCCGFCTLIKITSGGILSSISFLLVILNSWSTPATVALNVGLFLSGYLGWLVLHHLFLQRITVWFDNMFGFVSSLSDCGVPLESMHMIFIKDCAAFAFKCLKRIFPFYIILAILFLFRGNTSSTNAYSWNLAGAAVFILYQIYLVMKHRLYKCRVFDKIQNATAYIYLLLAASLGLLAYLTPLSFFRFDPFSLCLLLLALIGILLPFLASFGTDNPIVFITNYGLICPFLVILYIACFLDRLTGNLFVSFSILSFTGIVTTFQLYQSFIRNPYRTSHLLGQNTPAPIGPAGDFLLTDAATSHFVTELKSTLASSGFRPGMDVLMYSAMPGLVFSVGGFSPGLPILNHTTVRGGNFHGASLVYLKKQTAQRLGQTWIFLNLRAIESDVFKTYIQEVGIVLSETHSLLRTIECGEHDITLEVWKPQPA